MKISLLINMKFIKYDLLAEKFSCSAIFNKKEFAIVSNLRFISRINLSMKKSFITLGPGLGEA